MQREMKYTQFIPLIEEISDSCRIAEAQISFEEDLMGYEIMKIQIGYTLIISVDTRLIGQINPKNDLFKDLVQMIQNHLNPIRDE